MKTAPFLAHSIMRSNHIPILSLFLAFLTGGQAAEPAQLTVRPASPGVELSWSATARESDGTVIRPVFELQRSLDLKLWTPLGERLRAASDTSDSALGLTLALDPPQAFYRLLSIEPAGIAKLGQGGAEVLGYGDAFAEQLQRIGQISPEEFATIYAPAPNYLPGISWNPTEARFWSEFNADPETVNEGKEPDQPGYRTTDFRLDAAEQAVFTRNGFVVSERLGAPSFAEVFYHLWHNDLPVFISCDALLQAWHRTYDAILEEVEETVLFSSVERMLDGMAAQLNDASSEVGDGVLQASVQDADFILTVARSLLRGTVASSLGQDARVAETLADIRAEELKVVPDFLGFCRMVDFSQFKVRGHYTHTERLGRYFQCLMWLGRTDVPVAGGPWIRCLGEPPRMASPRELGLAIVLWQLLNKSGEFQTWADAERTIATFVGTTDSLTFAQLGGILAGGGISTLGDVRDLATLERLQADLVRGELGVQNIRSDWFEQPFPGGQRCALPQTFTVFGQKFVPDSWALSQTVFSSILWVENGETNKVERRVPGALDVAFSVLGNDQVVPEIVSQIRGAYSDPDRPHALQFRDGLPYQHNLAAVRAVLDQQTPEAWDSNLYMNWLATLRELSAPTTDAKYPEAMRTRAWALKTLNTQLASWTHLRHDTILYAKQSYTGVDACSYPAGFVEPRIAFWKRLRQTALRAADQIAALRYEGSYDVVSNGDGLELTLAAIQARQVAHLQSFAAVVHRLEALATKELAQECFSPDEEEFVDTLMEERSSLGCGGPAIYSGWYPNLFYRTVYWFERDSRGGPGALFHNNYGAGAFDGLVADVHTDVPSVLDPGSVLHQAVGRVNLLMVAVDHGSDRFICAGPVSSHYEFEVIGNPRRLSDEEWRGLLGGELPPGVQVGQIEGLKPPSWTQGYLVPEP